MSAGGLNPTRVTEYIILGESPAQWREGPALITSRNEHCMVSWQGVLWVMGGQTNGASVVVTATTEYLDVQQGSTTWVTGPSLIQRRRQAAAVVVGGGCAHVRAHVSTRPQRAALQSGYPLHAVFVRPCCIECIPFCCKKLSRG
jgi:hypothetical protein